MTFTPAMLARLTATDSVSGPVDLADVIALLHAAGMPAAAWRIDDALGAREELEAELQRLEDYIAPEDHGAALVEKDEAIKAAEAERDDLQKELDALEAAEETLSFDPVRALAKAITTTEGLRETIRAYQTKIYQLEAAAKLAGKRKRKAK